MNCQQKQKESEVQEGHASETETAQQQDSETVSVETSPKVAKRLKIIRIILILTIILSCVTSLSICTFIFSLHLDLKELNMNTLVFYPISNSILTFGILMFILGIIAILSICKEWNIYLYFFQLFCLLSFIFIAIFTISMMSSTIQAKQCQQPQSYMEFKIYTTHKKAQDLFCSQSCNCIQYSKVQECPGWEATPYDSIFEQLQQSLSCSGWCSVNQKKYYIFTDKQKEDKTKEVSCYDAWLQWIFNEQQIMIILSFIVLVFQFSMIINMNCYMTIWEQQIKKTEIMKDQ